MTEFVCILKQKGEGCDYTIGCGTVAYSFEAADYDAAFEKVKLDFGWDDIEDEDYTAADVEDRFITGENALESFVIYKVKNKMETLLEMYVDAANSTSL